MTTDLSTIDGVPSLLLAGKFMDRVPAYSLEKRKKGAGGIEGA